MTNGCNMQSLNKLLLGTKKQEKDCSGYHYGMRLALLSTSAEVSRAEVNGMCQDQEVCR